VFCTLISSELLHTIYDEVVDTGAGGLMYITHSEHAGNAVHECGEYVGGVLQQLNGNT